MNKIMYHFSLDYILETRETDKNNLVSHFIECEKLLVQVL